MRNGDDVPGVMSGWGKNGRETMQRWGKLLGTVMILFSMIMAIQEMRLPQVVAAEAEELETFIRARIEIGEFMGRFMRERGGFGGSMEEMRQMENEINAKVAHILGSHGMTIEEYRERSPAVFSDEEAVQAFLAQHPELKRRYEVLPFHQSRPGRGMPH
jgi:hypothetical protein